MAGFHVDYLEEEDPRVFFVNRFSEYSYEFFYQKPYGAILRGESFDLHGLDGAGAAADWERQAERLAEDLKAVVDTFKPERFMLAGYGPGGAVIISFIERFGYEYGERLAGVAVIESDEADDPEEKLLSKLLAHRRRHQPDVHLYQYLVDKLGCSSLYYVCVRCRIRRVILEPPIEDIYALLFESRFMK